MAIWDHADRIRSSNNLSAEARQLADDLGMNRSQAVNCLTQIRKMRSGERFSNYTKDESTRYFLSRFEEEGIEALRRALDSFGQTIKYANDRGYAIQECVALHRLFTSRLENHDQLADARTKLDRAELDASQLTPEERKRRMDLAPALPTRRQVTTWVYDRDPNVRAERRLAANGICGGCNQPAPFARKDGTPYLEVHHIKPLSELGEDKLHNTIALCPNCHRKTHIHR